MSVTKCLLKGKGIQKSDANVFYLEIEWKFKAKK